MPRGGFFSFLWGSVCCARGQMERKEAPQGEGTRFLPIWIWRPLSRFCWPPHCWVPFSISVAQIYFSGLSWNEQTLANKLYLLSGIQFPGIPFHHIFGSKTYSVSYYQKPFLVFWQAPFPHLLPPPPPPPEMILTHNAFPKHMSVCHHANRVRRRRNFFVLFPFRQVSLSGCRPKGRKIYFPFPQNILNFIYWSAATNPHTFSHFFFISLFFRGWGNGGECCLQRREGSPPLLSRHLGSSTAQSNWVIGHLRK